MTYLEQYCENVYQASVQMQEIPARKDNRRIIIIEAKRSKKEADLDKDCDEAIDQIAAGKYAEGLYGYTQILCYGISFFQKQAKVKKMV